jgi:hypothetical protein
MPQTRNEEEPVVTQWAAVSTRSGAMIVPEHIPRGLSMRTV